MNDDALPPAVPAAIPSQEGTADAARAAPYAAAHRRWWLIGVSLLLAAVFGAAYLEQRHQTDGVRAQLEQQNKSVAEVEKALAAARREAEQTRSQVAQLDQALAELKAQRADLDQLYLELSRGRDEAALIDVDRMVNLALQELQIAGNVGAALTALQTADGRLARLNRPQLTPLRRALGRDIDRLKAIAPIDITGNALRLDQLVRQVDTLPLLADPGTRLPVTRPAPAPAPPASPPDDRPWVRFRAWLAREFGDLVQIREVAAPESVLLSGQQQQAVRERLRLRLLDARQSLLARNDRLYRADLAEAQALLARFFDVKAPATQQMLAQLKQLAGLALTLEPPSLADSLEALRAARPGATR
jgi:uroporphyrin-3 C-methyltransferase/uroporphyrinogen III methyltransferase/synthase